MWTGSKTHIHDLVKINFITEMLCVEFQYRLFTDTQMESHNYAEFEYFVWKYLVNASGRIWKMLKT